MDSARCALPARLERPITWGVQERSSPAASPVACRRSGIDDSKGSPLESSMDMLKGDVTSRAMFCASGGSVPASNDPVLKDLKKELRKALGRRRANQVESKPGCMCYFGGLALAVSFDFEAAGTTLGIPREDTYATVLSLVLERYWPEYAGLTDEVIRTVLPVASMPPDAGVMATGVATFADHVWTNWPHGDLQANMLATGRLTGFMAGTRVSNDMMVEAGVFGPWRPPPGWPRTVEPQLRESGGISQQDSALSDARVADQAAPAGDLAAGFANEPRQKDPLAGVPQGGRAIEAVSVDPAVARRLRTTEVTAEDRTRILFSGWILDNDVVDGTALLSIQEWAETLTASPAVKAGQDAEVKRFLQDLALRGYQLGRFATGTDRIPLLYSNSMTSYRGAIDAVQAELEARSRSHDPEELSALLGEPLLALLYEAAGMQRPPAISFMAEDLALGVVGQATILGASLAITECEMCIPDLDD